MVPYSTNRSILHYGVDKVDVVDEDGAPPMMMDEHTPNKLELRRLGGDGVEISWSVCIKYN